MTALRDGTVAPDRSDPPPPPEPGAAGDLVDALRRLAVLRDRDELTEEEFQQAKERLVRERRAGQ
jgi:hypothetical protein